METTILEVSHLDVFYRDGMLPFLPGKKRSQVLHDISFQMKKGEILGILGESGCGKTTLVKALLSMDMDYQGKIHHFSKRPQMVFQDPYSSLNPAKKVGWILEEPLRMERKYSSEERRAKVEAMLKRVGLEQKIAHRFPSELSGGQRQRVCIGAALICEPELLIADEPVSALDVTIQAQILKLLAGLQEEMKLSVLFISHDLRIIAQMCDRLLVMKDGRIVEQGSPEQLYQTPGTGYMNKLLECAGIS